MLEFMKKVAKEERIIGLYFDPSCGGGWCLEVDDMHFYGTTPEEVFKNCQEYHEFCTTDLSCPVL